MLKKIGIVILAVMFIVSLSLPSVIDTVDAAAKCQCKGDGKDCQCGPDCKCEHCAAGKDAKGDCHCGKGCVCDHCKTGKGECQCKGDGKEGCKCGKSCQCEHCKTGKGECQCKGDSKGGCKCGKDCKGEHCGHGAAAVKAKPASDADYAKTMESKKGIFKATYTSDPEAIPANKMISWRLKIETADGKAVTDAKLTVDGAMPEHGHGLPTQPKVTKNLGDGTYLVEGIKFSMPGWWTMKFSITSGGKTDSVTFNLQLK